MSITASGFFGLTLEKIFKKTQTADLESETAVYCMMVRDAFTPAFDTHDFRADVTSEVTAGNGYTSGGAVLTTTELAVGSPAAGQMNYDSADPQWATATITDAMAAIHYFTTGASATDQLLYLADFVTAATASNGTFTISVDTDGWWYIDFTP
jgi:hypothetical protein